MHEQGGSTITMQLSRGFFLTPEKTIRRKLTEMLIAEELEQKFTKQQIFEFYGNWVNLGQRGSFAISGFGEACRAYFNKDLKDITLPEAALLAGLSKDRAGSRPTGIPSALWNAEIWCWNRWWKPTPSRASKPTRRKPQL